MFARLKFSIILFALVVMLKVVRFCYPTFAERLKQRNLVAQIKALDERIGRWISIRDGRITSRHGIHAKPDVTLSFKNATIGASLLTPPINWLNQINAQKDFVLTVDGPEDLSNWFAQTLMMMQTAGWKFGMRMADGTVRYCNMANGGPLFVYVKDGKIIRTTPIAFDETDPKPWTIHARGIDFAPPRKTTLAPHGQNSRSMIYSPDRLLYPMKRVDFDPKGERNTSNRGKSGYVRTSWDEALDIVADEIKRVRHDHGPGAMTVSHGSHHTWGHIGYYLSCLFRFRNAVGHTPIHHNPDSWEGWYWGAAHHWGYTLRVGQCETYGTVEDLLQNCEMVVFWASDPDTTSGSYGSQEGTVRRQWLKKLGVKIVHIDPFYNSSAQFLPGKWICPKPTTSPALAMAIAYVWINEGLYDKEYVATHTVGFDAWKTYIMGDKDSVPKTPEWQEKET
jgi:anaerobic selenocysteine-containing dehydrogenase